MGLRLNCARKLGVPLSGDAFVRELLELHKGSGHRSRLKREHGISLKMLQWEWASSCVEGESLGFFLRLGGKFGVPFSSCNEDPRAPIDHIASGKSGLILSCDGRIGLLSCHCKGNRPSFRYVSRNSTPLQRWLGALERPKGTLFPSKF